MIDLHIRKSQLLESLLECRRNITILALAIIINTGCKIIVDRLLHTNYPIYIFRTLGTSLFDIGLIH